MRSVTGRRAPPAWSVSRQVTVAQAAAYPEPGRVQGAWFHGGLTRMDDEQHTLSAMVRSLPIADADLPGCAGATSDLPRPVGIVALLALANPARTGPGLPRGGPIAPPAPGGGPRSAAASPPGR